MYQQPPEATSHKFELFFCQNTDLILLSILDFQTLLAVYYCYAVFQTFDSKQCPKVAADNFRTFSVYFNELQFIVQKFAEGIEFIVYMLFQTKKKNS